MDNDALEQALRICYPHLRFHRLGTANTACELSEVERLCITANLMKLLQQEIEEYGGNCTLTYKPCNLRYDATKKCHTCDFQFMVAEFYCPSQIENEMKTISV